MKSFAGKLAVVTGGASGIGQELVYQLTREGCSVALCDMNGDGMAQTARRAKRYAPAGTRVTVYRCDVSDEEEVGRFRDHVTNAHQSDHIDLLFNNAGIGGAPSFLKDPRADWERVFEISFWGVYNCCRAFAPLLVASDDSYLVNTSSLNGFWAAFGPGLPGSAYSTAKFAVKGFTESLLFDFRHYAPHVKVALVMPGHVGSNMFGNSRRILGRPEPEDLDSEELAEIRAELRRRGSDPPEGDDELRVAFRALDNHYRVNAPTTPAEAATVILDGLRAERWRILVGDDVRLVDERVRADPEGAYADPHGTYNFINRS